jgi:hypothetical protein
MLVSPGIRTGKAGVKKALEGTSMLGRRRRAEAAAGTRRPGLRWLAGAVGLAAAAMTVLVMQPAGANPVTVRAQLSLSGVVTATSPLGGTTVGVHPGDSVTFQASLTPTAGLDALGLSALVDALNTVGGITMVADFSQLPGASKLDTLTTKASAYALSGTKSATFTFPAAGTYHFTWTARNLLGVINLDGNQLAAAGIKLNAQNQYVGEVVVADNPPQGGISLQLPGVSVAPSLAVVGQLPTVGVPNVTAPTIPVAVPTIVPGLPGSSGKPGGQPSSGLNYTPPPLSVPEQVVPKGDGAVAGPDLNADPDLAIGGFGDALPALGSNGGAAHPASSTAREPAAVPAGHPVSEKPVEIAASPQSPSGQLPVILAIVAIVALSLVTATYARLYLLRKNG